jgi:hypothetical protein
MLKINNLLMFFSRCRKYITGRPTRDRKNNAFTYDDLFMTGITTGEIGKGLFQYGTSDTDRINVLTSLVLDLMLEVEALRSARIQQGDDITLYRKSYRDTALLSHNTAGPGFNCSKLIRLFYPDRRDGDSRVLRESIMLQKLGCSEEEVAEFQRDVATVETYT